LEGWTSAKAHKKKAVPDAEADEKDEKEREKEKKRADKVSDLRRRKANINQQIKRLEENLGGSSGGARRDDEERKTLEARSRLQEDLERVNRSIERLTNPASAEQAAMETWGDDYDYDYDWYAGDWEYWDEWGTAEWSSWDTGNGQRRGKGKGRGSRWEDEGGGFAGEEWQEQDWWDSAATASTGTTWVEKNSAQKRRGRKQQQWPSAWWEDASWEEGDGHASASSWQGAGSGTWEGGEWPEDGGQDYEAGNQNADSRKRERRRKGDKGEGKGKGKRRDGGDESNRLEDDATRNAGDGDEGDSSPSAPRSPAQDRKRDRKGRGKGKEGKDQENGEENFEGRESKGKDSKGKGKGKSKGKKGKDERIPEEETGNMEDWLSKRLGNKSAVEVETEVNPERTVTPEPTGAEVVRQAIAPLFGNRTGERPNWGDAESSDEDRPVAVARPGRSAHLTAALKKSSDMAPASQTRADSGHGDGAKDEWDEDLAAFISGPSLGDDAKFEQELKYVPTWVREKALRRRKQLLRQTDN